MTSPLTPELIAEAKRRASEVPDLSEAKRAELRALMQPMPARVSREPERRAS